MVRYLVCCVGGPGEAEETDGVAAQDVGFVGGGEVEEGGFGAGGEGSGEGGIGREGGGFRGVSGGFERWFGGSSGFVLRSIVAESSGERTS